MFRTRVIATAATTTALLIGAMFVPTGAQARHLPMSIVHQGESIQAALDAAAPGGTILVSRGDYYENLTITKPVTLRGIGDVVLRPAAAIAANLCTNDPDGSPDGAPNNTGICILGQFAAPSDGSDIPTVIVPVADVTVEHLRISGFHGQGVLAFGTSRLVISHINTDHNGDTGLFFESADHTRILDNAVTETGHFAVRVADSRDVVADGNRIRSAQAGIVGIEVSGGRITDNVVTDTCLGIGLLDTPEPGVAGDLAISENLVTRNSRFCPADPGGPSISGIGVALIGASGVKVVENRITNNVAQNDPVTGEPAMLPGAGLLVMDATDFTGGGAATNNVVRHNVIIDNVPVDVLDISTGINRIAHNKCQSSAPVQLCS